MAGWEDGCGGCGGCRDKGEEEGEGKSSFMGECVRLRMSRRRRWMEWMRG